MNDVRWFASNSYTALLVPSLRRLGLKVATEGDGPARLALAMSGRTAVQAWRYAARRCATLLLYLWDLPPEGTGRGRADPVWWIGGRLLRIPRPWGGYRRRPGYYSRLRYIALRADAIWVPSAMTRDIVAQRFGVTGERLPYCYDSERFFPGRPAARSAPPTLLTVSRLRPHKNQAVVLQAAALLRRSIVVRLIGRGPEQANLAALAARLGVACTIETSADDETVARAYHEAAVAVCPSRFEGFGLTPIEAVASALPVVASDIPPHREFVGQAARLAPPEDPVAMAEAIAEALEAPPADPSLIRDLTIPAAAARFYAAIQPHLG